MCSGTGTGQCLAVKPLPRLWSISVDKWPGRDSDCMGRKLLFASGRRAVEVRRGVG